MAAPDRPATVVVADDDDLVRAVLRMALESSSLTIREAADSQSLAAALEDGAVDLTILDISIPGPGLAVNLLLVRESAPDSRILILSGDAEVPSSEAPLIDEFARKPIDLSELRDRVARLLTPPNASA
jgi:two-component system, OmpR family, response regulator